MRVALVCPYDLGRPGGVQGQVLGLAAQLRRRGHEVGVLGPGRPGPHVDETLPASVVSSAGRGVAVPANGSVAGVALAPATSRRVRAWLDRVRPDVVHVHEPGVPALGPAAVRGARARAVPVVATFHAARPAQATDPLLRALLRGLLGPLPVTTAVSASARDLAASLCGTDPELVPNAVDVPGLAARPGPDGLLPPPLRDGAPTLLLLGRRDEPRKGLDVLREALGPLRTVVPGVRLVLAGPGRTRVDGAVDLGEVDASTRRALLHTCDVLVAPHTGRESFGIVLVEAMAAGTPVVASDLPAFREVLGGAGLLVPAGDPGALAAALAEVLTDDARRATLGARGADRARRWDWGLVTDRWERVYDRACRAPGGGS